MISKGFSSKEFASIGLVEKNMKVDEMIEEAEKLGVHSGLLAMIYSRMFKITEKFLEIEKRLAAVEKNIVKAETVKEGS